MRLRQFAAVLLLALSGASALLLASADRQGVTGDIPIRGPHALWLIEQARDVDWEAVGATAARLPETVRHLVRAALAADAASTSTGERL